jgi:hypothetical protein
MTGRRSLVACLLLCGLATGMTGRSTPASPRAPRDASVWPFAPDDPWNVPLGSGATFDSAQVLKTAQWINYTQYSISVYYASRSDPWRTVRASGGDFPRDATVRMPPGARGAVGTDLSLVVISPDRRFSDEWLQFDRGKHAGTAGDPYTAGKYLHVDLRKHAFLGPMRGAGTSFLGGLIRPRDIAAHSIRHVLAFASHGSDLQDLGNPADAGPNPVRPPPGSGPCPIWPAVRCDGAQEAGLLAIPPGVPKPAGLSPLGSAIWDALQHYGAYDVDNAGANVFYAQDQQSDPRDAAAIAAATRDMPTVQAAMRWVTNNSQSHPGGPGARLAPLAPGF